MLKCNMTFESIIKVAISDPPEKRAKEIAEGSYACALLHDDYGWSADQIIQALDNAADDVYFAYPDSLE